MLIWDKRYDNTTTNIIQRNAIKKKTQRKEERVTALEDALTQEEYEMAAANDRNIETEEEQEEEEGAGDGGRMDTEEEEGGHGGDSDAETDDGDNSDGENRIDDNNRHSIASGIVVTALTPQATPYTPNRRTKRKKRIATPMSSRRRQLGFDDNNKKNRDNHDDDKAKREYTERAKWTTSVNSPRSASVDHPSGRMGAADGHIASDAVPTTSHDHGNHNDDKDDGGQSAGKDNHDGSTAKSKHKDNNKS